MEDIATTTAVSAGMYALIPGSKLELIPEAGRLSNLDQPAMFNRILLEHLQSL
ncbi:alpha/beta fold hydrolase [Chlorobaculum sp. 24CR]|uniref:alpha/beta fold hydrolase n=1 Tax=Chlorobaculum sp. 24CR TaxID=2508878 RepID=UPI001FD6CC14|nr:hypothetical protein [Chlorobaculum sp. 24CR]